MLGNYCSRIWTALSYPDIFVRHCTHDRMPRIKCVVHSLFLFSSSFDSIVTADVIWGGCVSKTLTLQLRRYLPLHIAKSEVP